MPSVADLRRQFLRFALVGVFGTAVHYAILFAGVQFAALPPVAASAVGFAAGAVTNYLLNYFFTFASTGDHVITGSRFAVVVTAGWVGNLLLMTLFVHLIGWHYLLAQIITTIIVLFWNFGGSRLWAFREA